MTQGNSLSME